MFLAFFLGWCHFIHVFFTSERPQYSFTNYCDYVYIKGCTNKILNKLTPFLRNKVTKAGGKFALSDVEEEALVSYALYKANRGFPLTRKKHQEVGR